MANAMRSRINIRSPRETPARYTHRGCQPHAVAADTVLGRGLFRGVGKLAVRLDHYVGTTVVASSIWFYVVILMVVCHRANYDSDAGAVDRTTVAPIARTCCEARIIDFRVGAYRSGSCPQSCRAGEARRAGATRDLRRRALPFWTHRCRPSPRRLSCRCL